MFIINQGKRESQRYCAAAREQRLKESSSVVREENIGKMLLVWIMELGSYLVVDFRDAWRKEICWRQELRLAGKWVVWFCWWILLWFTGGDVAGWTGRATWWAYQVGVEQRLTRDGSRHDGKALSGLFDQLGGSRIQCKLRSVLQEELEKVRSSTQLFQ